VVLCICRSITVGEVETAIRDGASSLEEIAERCEAGTDCGACCEDIEKRLHKCDGRCADCPRSLTGAPEAAPGR
jgi:bacterioferritin-associated ferredoxin